MANIRSSLPSRLRQFLSGETAIGPSIKLDSEPPSQIKAFIDKVIQSPLQDIAIPLSGFQWEYSKGSFHHWRLLFRHFDTYFKTYLSYRNDLLLSDKILEDDSPFPKHAVLQILRVMQTILENCPNKGSFDGLEHFKLLLSSTDPEILIATLETLSALVKINTSKIHGSGKLIGCGTVNSYLLSLAQGWGSKVEGLGLYSCVLANERTQEEGLSLFPSNIENDHGKSQHRIGSSLYFELHWLNTQNTEESSASSTSRVIHIPDLHLQKEDDLLIMKQCFEQYNIPTELRFSLLTRIRYAHAFRSPRICRLYSRICLLAFIVLVQSNDANDELTSFFANEPEYTNELIRIVRSEETIPGTIRTLAMLALGAQLAAYSASHDRARILSGSSISFTVGNRTILLNVLQKAVLSLKGSSDPSFLAFIEALLQFYLLHIVSSSASGSNIRGSGMVPTFLPFLEDSDPNHMHLVYLAVKALQKLGSSAVSLLRELGGVELLAQRLQMEVHRIIGMSGSNENSMVIGECSRYNDDQLYSQKRLIKVLLKLGSATYAPANSTRPQNPHDSFLPGTLSLIYGNADKFGGDIYYSAVTVMSEIIHKHPTCLPALLELGLPDAFLSSVLSGLLPSSKAITCVPNGLGAICLNPKGLEAVKETSALRFLVNIFTNKKYVLAVNEAIVPLADAVEELLRHESSLRSSGVDIIIEIVNKIASIGDSSSFSSSSSMEKVNGCTAMETDSEDRGNEEHCCLVGVADSVTEGISDEQCLQLCILHLMVLLHRTTENAETCRLFVEKSGIEALLKLLLRPSIVQSSEGMSIALHSTMVFKGFTQHHSASLSRAFCSSLREHLKKALTGFGAASGSVLLDPKMMPYDGVFSPLFLVEFLLFLAASKDNRWVSALLAELANGSKDVLEDIGRVHREILWQIALLEDAKVEMEDDGASSSSTDPMSQQRDSSASDTEEQRLNSFRQLLDPLLRRRTPGWGIESQFFDLINLYRDLGRATSFQQRLVIDGSNMRFGSNHSTSLDASGSINRKEHDNQRSYHTSCCDMVRSLSFHITHLFQELGKVMLLPSRRRDDTVNASPASKSVASSFASIAFDHMNLNSSGSESISTKCRYFGKVIDFIDSVLLDRPDSCNAIILNCIYGRGVVQSVLTTFEATSQLLFAVNRPPASPMDTDDGNVKQDEKEDGDYVWIYGPLASYAKLMDHLVTSSFILSPFTKHLLVQPLASGDVSFPRDAETFVKVLQSMVLKAVLPVWTHPQITDCSYDFITTVISIIRHIYSGVEVKNVTSNNSARITGPPPNETAIATIVEMGFSRSRAEEALRQVGSISVELAMEWLFSHPEETQEDDELARALAMSLGNSETDPNVDVISDSNQQLEEEMVQLPPVEELLSTCTKLLQMKEPLAFPVRDLIILICSQNDGQYRSNVISFILDQVRDSSSASDSRNNSMLSALFHVLALVLHEDVGAREIASKTGLVKLVTDLLSEWDSGSGDKKHQVPKWVTTAFLALDRLLQVDQKLNSEIIEQMKGGNVGSQQTSVIIDEDKKSKLHSSFGSLRHIDIHEQKRLIEIACSCIKNQFPSETMHAVLQLCSTLTRTHSVAVCFLDGGALSSLLSLPTSSLFSGFDNITATIIRHVLEDPQTLQQAMEGEIKHSLAAMANRHSNGRVSPRNFLVHLSSVISRDPVIFMQAVKSVCQVDMVGDRPYVVLIKDGDKDKCKEKEKEKDKAQQNDGKGNLCNMNAAGPGNGLGKFNDSNSKSVKIHKKSAQSFVNVIELLLDSVGAFVPPLTDDIGTEVPVDGPSSTDMEIDVAAIKGKGKAIATVSEENEVSGQDASASLAKTVFILKLLTEILLMYASSVQVLLRRDGEISSCRVPHQRASTGLSTGGIFHHILHRFIPYSQNSKKERKIDGDWNYKLATRASQFLVASCVRSAEARKRVFTEISCIFNGFVDSCDGFKPPSSDMQTFVDLLNDILVARTPSGSCISAEASATFIDVGLVASLTCTLEVLDLDHTESPKVVTGLIKALELVTKEHVHSGDSSAMKGENSVKSAHHNQTGGTDNIVDASQSMEMASQSNHDAVGANQVESFNTVQNYGGSEAVTDDMEHDQDLDGGFAPATEDDYMQETNEDARGLENGVDNVGIHFEIQPHEQENLDDDDGDDDDDDDDDDEMSGDDGDEVDEDDDDDDHNDLEEDDVQHLPHRDTDQDDHEIDDDEFDDEVLEEDDEDDGDDEGGVILRLEEGINGMDVFDHVEVFGRDHSFANETLHVMPVEVFGSRRQGRTTSIYSLLGRSGENSAPSRHPLLLGPSSLRTASTLQSENARDMILPDRNSDSTSSRLDTIFRSLRNGRHSHRLNLWVDESQQSSGSSAATVPQGLEELLVSQLRRPVPDKSSDHNTSIVEPQTHGEDSELQESAAGARPEIPVENNVNNENANAPPSSAAIDSSLNADGRPAVSDSLQGTDASSIHSPSVEMQFEQNDVAVRDVEAVSQESSGSGATLGESLRSLDVEIGSADGHDDGGERQGSSDRTPDPQAARARRTNVAFGNSTPAAGRDAPLHSVTEVPENSSRESDQDGSAAEQQINRNAGSGSIDPAFLDALPEELRAEVLSAQQGQVAQPSNAEQQNSGDIDPEFLAALPPDIRAEVLAQQQAQRLHQSQELEGQPVEMDTVSIIATFPSDLREEVLLTSSDAILANLTPALVAEANMLRERFAHRYHNHNLFGMYPRNRRGESSRRGEGIGSSLDRMAGSIVSRRSVSAKLIEAEGAPLVGREALQGMVRLLRMVQPLYKGSLQKLLLNLCAHNETRTALVKILMDMLLLDTRKPVGYSNAIEPPYRLYGCQNNVIYSRPQNFDGVPPLVSRRVLEILTYLARNHPHFAKILLQFGLPLPTLQEPRNIDQSRGKALMTDEQREGYISVALLLSLLNEPLYLRSIAHLEQLLNLLDVIVDHAERKPLSSEKLRASSTEQMPALQISMSDADISVENRDAPSEVAESPLKTADSSSPSASGATNECDVLSVLTNLPRAELRLLCSLLGREGSKIKHQHDHHHHSPLRISVRRAYILEDSYNQLRMRSTQDLKGRLTVHFQGEEGIDAGGLTREWYQLLSRVIFDRGALLFTTVGNESTFQPNPNSVYQTEHLSYFKFVGRVVGKALLDGQLLDVHFTRSFYKHILGVKVTYHDIEATDPDYFKNLKWMLENDISDVPDLTFSIDADEEKLILYEKTQVTDYELIPGGRNIKVTEENKHQYVDLVAEHRLTTAIRPQINAFLEGFNELIPRELISIFNDKELELLISGLPDIDLDDMRANTEYSGYSAASLVIQWFWEVAQGFSKEDKARLLQFVTGTSKVPLEGFSALQGISGSQKFQIHKAYGSPDHLPSAHTCFNQLDLPEYPSKEHLEERLLLAIHEANEGFGFG
ncbi:E3 ubiquitin-protein ligase UPL2-like isoform X2 [Durio zibethinus]|uniref:HECT-type E3 ubiquitin transferase n=1 Tax=Durio zibethinus TaxID=66656 RepID=A0A6P6AUB5_DURZI|nr:E3 ubiquitin-protein ligase UPL2-like isoform X2 [Durio zibethinus]